MSLKDKASLIFKPSRYKSGKAYSFRGEDFTFTRSSVGTRVNSSGELEEVASGVPRLNYDGTDLTKCPSLLLEKSRTNLIYRSQELNLWTAVNSTVTANASISPEGVANSFRITENSATSTQHRIVLGSIGGSSAIYTMSAYVKNVNGNRLAYIDMGPVTAHFNFSTKAIYSANGTADFEDVGNGWYRIWVISNSAVSVVSCFAGLSVNNSETYSGDGSSAIDFYGLQLEAGNYPTSLIKTNGASVTRSEDFFYKTGISSLIGQTESTLFIDFTFDGHFDIYSELGIFATQSNRYALYTYNATNTLRGYLVASNSTIFETNVSDALVVGKSYKVAFKVKSGEIAVYINGVSKYTNTSTFSFNDSLDKYKFSTYADFFKWAYKTNETVLFKTGLTSEDLVSLTSYDDYQELVDRNELTWESPTITNNRLTALQEL